LRKREIGPAVVRDLLQEQSALMRLPLDRFRDLIFDTDFRNAQRIERYRPSFGELNAAAKTVVTILMKSSLIDSANPLPDDPLSEEVEQARGVRRAYFQFVLPARQGSTPQRHNGYIEFQLSLSHGLWVPTWANFNGEPVPLFSAEAFVPLRPYRIVFDPIANTFVIAQEPLPEVAPLFSLMSSK
jgi:hypothetical protein